MQRPTTAVLYDAENVPAGYLPQVLEVADRFEGGLVVRAFGPPSLMASPAWRGHSLEYGVDRVLCDGCKAGKNSADISLVVDVMDMLSVGVVENFVIVSGDTDFAPVVRRLRQEGKNVLGVGLASANQVYRSLFDSFTVLDPTRAGRRAIKRAAKRGKSTKIDDATIGLLLECAQTASAPDSWCEVSRLCVLVRKQRPSFSPKQYGCKNVTKLLEKTGQFDVRRTDHGNYVKLRSM